MFGSKNKKIAQLQQLLKDQEHSAKMLVRRDLELQRATERLKKLEQDKSEFISIAAHQLRTPLSEVKWSLDILKKDMEEASNEKQKELLRKAIYSNERVIGIVDDLLNVDTATSGKLEYEFKKESIVALVEEEIATYTDQIEKKKIVLTCASDVDKKTTVNLDEEKIRSVIQNLMDNAIKYTGDEGYIKVHISSTDGFIKVAIADNGIGIPENEKKNIFGKFFRSSNAIIKETVGSGLGLFYAAMVIKRHGGKIWFDSKEGVGTTFYFTVPV